LGNVTEAAGVVTTAAGPRDGGGDEAPPSEKGDVTAGAPPHPTRSAAKEPEATDSALSNMDIIVTSPPRTSHDDGQLNDTGRFVHRLAYQKGNGIVFSLLKGSHT